MKSARISSLLLLLFAFSLEAFSQQQVVYTEKIKKGIYRTFEEFRANAPSITDSFDLVPRDDVKRSFTLSSADNELKLIGPDGKKRNPEGEVWGLYDGKQFFIHTFGYNSLYKLGKYSVFEVTSHDPGTTSGNTIVINRKIPDYILNFETGEVKQATKNNILEILSDDKELYDDFVKDGSRRDMVYIYMERYSKRHPISYPAAKSQ
jgi:hypothetical protein